MKKIDLNIVFILPNTHDVGFAISFAGISTRKYLYLKQVSVTDGTYPYIRIKRSDTHLCEPVFSCYKPDQHRQMVIISRYFKFRSDPRIKILPDTHPMVEKVNAYIEEREKYEHIFK